MISEGKAGLLRPKRGEMRSRLDWDEVDETPKHGGSKRRIIFPEWSSGQFGGIFNWTLSQAEIRGGLSWKVQAPLFWLSRPMPQSGIRVHLFGDTGDKRIGAVIAHAECDSDLSEIPLNTLITTGVVFWLTEILDFEIDAVRPKLDTINLESITV